MFGREVGLKTKTVGDKGLHFVTAFAQSIEYWYCTKLGDTLTKQLAPETGQCVVISGTGLLLVLVADNR